MVAQHMSHATFLIFQNLRREFKQSSIFSSCCTPEKDRIITAVKCLSFSVDAGEVLGLLGHNAAGKTTTLRVLTGEIAPSKGSVKIGGIKITNSHSDAFKMIGYCPQSDAIWKNVTVREHLECYAAIRGVPAKDRKRFVKNLELIFLKSDF